MTTSSDKKRFNVKLKAELDFKVLGSRLRGDMKVVAEHFSKMTDEELSALQQTGSLTVAGHTLTLDDVRLKYSFGEQKDSIIHQQYDAHSDSQVVAAVYSCSITNCPQTHTHRQAVTV